MKIGKADRIEKLVIKAGYGEKLHSEDFLNYKEKFDEWEKKEQEALQNGLELVFPSLAIHPSVYENPLNYLKRILWVRTNGKKAIVAFYTELAVSCKRFGDKKRLVDSEKKLHLHLVRVKLDKNFIESFIKVARKSEPVLTFSRECKAEYEINFFCYFGFLIVLVVVDQLIVNVDKVFIPLFVRMFGTFMIPVLLICFLF